MSIFFQNPSDPFIKSNDVVLRVVRGVTPYHVMFELADDTILLNM
jgi:hypothetical protein